MDKWDLLRPEIARLKRRANFKKMCLYLICFIPVFFLFYFFSENIPSLVNFSLKILIFLYFFKMYESVKTITRKKSINNLKEDAKLKNIFNTKVFPHIGLSFSVFSVSRNPMIAWLARGDKIFFSRYHLDSFGDKEISAIMFHEAGHKIAKIIFFRELQILKFIFWGVIFLYVYLLFVSKFFLLPLFILISFMFLHLCFLNQIKRLEEHVSDLVSLIFIGDKTLIDALAKFEKKTNKESFWGFVFSNHPSINAREKFLDDFIQKNKF